MGKRKVFLHVHHESGKKRVAHGLIEGKNGEGIGCLSKKKRSMKIERKKKIAYGIAENSKGRNHKKKKPGKKKKPRLGRKGG